MVSGDASREFKCKDHRKRNPARYCAPTSAATLKATPLRRVFCQLRTALAGRCQAAALALGIIVNLTDKALMALDTKLNHHIDKQIQQVLDIRSGQFLATATLFDQQNELFEGELRARRVHARNRSRMTRIHFP